jgi:hypothetical protein
MKEINETQLQLSTEGKRLPDMIKQAFALAEFMNSHNIKFESISI